MKKSVHPGIAAIVIVLIVAVVGFFVYRGTSTTTAVGEKPPGMPSDVSAEFQKRMGSNNVTGGKPAGGQSVPLSGSLMPPVGH